MRTTTIDNHRQNPRSLHVAGAHGCSMLAAEAGSAPATGSELAVDVVIDNYNYGRFLASAIDSALAQEHPHTRVIVVDDGSTDDSREVMARYGDRITTIFKSNGGQASAFNAGLKHCQGDIVIFLNADDLLLAHAAGGAAAMFAQLTGVVKVQSRMMVIDAEGRATGVIKPHSHMRLLTGDLRREELTFPFDLPWIANGGNAFSLPALRRVMPIPEAEFAEGADWYLQHLVPLLGDVAATAEVSACYRVHGFNSYERERPVLDLPHIRQSIRYAAATRRHLRRLAGELGLAMPPGPILSVADLANRLISCKLEPDAHPLPSDRLASLVLGGTLAATRRFDVRWPVKLMFAGWFAAMAMAPRRAAPPLTEVFMFPERRRRLTSLLGIRSSASRSSEQAGQLDGGDPAAFVPVSLPRKLRRRAGVIVAGRRGRSPRTSASIGGETDPPQHRAARTRAGARGGWPTDR